MKTYITTYKYALMTDAKSKEEAEEIANQEFKNAGILKDFEVKTKEVKEE